MSKRAHLTPQVRAYTKVGSYEIQVLVGLREDEDDKDDGPPPGEHAYGWKPMWLKIRPRSGRPIYMHLTGMTLEELECLERAFEIALADAKEAASDLDQQAYQVMMEGAKEVPLRALASAPPWFSREQDLRYESPQRRAQADNELYEEDLI